MKSLALSHDLSLPLDFASRTIAIFGIRGAGKTNTASVLIEELLELNLPPVIIDPTDAWWGLRSKYPVFIFGGSHGDMPLQETDGKLIAQFIVTEKVPVILSLRHLRKNAQRRFVTDFCEEIYHLKGKDENRTSLMVVIDEAPLFVPQKVMGENARTVGAVEDLIARGRSSGFGVALISQRPATLNKDVLTQADAIIVHRITSPQDRKALGEWFDDSGASGIESTSTMNSLSSLAAGMAWVWAPTLGIMQRTQVRRRRTYDSGATPKVGEIVTAPKKLTEVNLDALKGKMAEALQQAKDNDPVALKAKIRELEKQIKTIPIPFLPRAPDTVLVPNKEFVAELDLLRRQLSEATVEIGNINVHLNGPLASIDACRDRLAEMYGKMDAIKLSTNPVTAVSPRRQAPAAAPRNERRATVDSALGNLSAVDRAFLTVLAQRMGKHTARNQLAVFAGYSATSRHVDNTISGLRTRGYLDGDSQHLMITDAGADALGGYKALPTGAALADYWCQKAGTAEGAMLRKLVDCYPLSMSRDQLAEATGYSVTSRHVDNTISHLRTLELISGTRDSLKANEELIS